MLTPGFLFAADREQLADMTSVAEARRRFASLPLERMDAETRAQLYLLLGASSLEEAYLVEQPVHEAEEGPSLAQLDAPLVARLATLNEDQVPRLADDWAGSSAAEVLELTAEELETFLFALAGLCRDAVHAQQSVYLAIE